jgi:small conductance mechanosensitive channel
MSGESAVSESLGPIQTVTNAWQKFFGQWPSYVVSLLTAALIIAVGCILLRLGRRLIRKICARTANRKKDRTAVQTKTIQSLATSIFNYTMFFAIALITLSALGVDVSSLLTIAGVGGVALGFGCQTLVKDFISGMFLWGEGRLNVGDIVTIAGHTGVVEEIALRTTTLRDNSGYVYTIPNGDVRTVINMSRDFRWAQVDLPMSHGQDWAAMIDVLQDEMNVFAEREQLEDTPQVIGLIASDRFSATLRIQLKCEVNDDWMLEREIRQAALTRLAKEGFKP